MNPNTNQTDVNPIECCPGSCKTVYEVAGIAIVNNYRCGQRPFSVSDMWHIQRSKKDVSRTTGLL